MSMPVTHLILWITEACNLRCDYCFVEKSEKKMSLDTGKAAVDFLLKPEVSWQEHDLKMTFFGGEPLLEFDTLKGIVNYWNTLKRTVNKQIHFTLVTNGTLLDAEMADFLTRNRVAILYSFDGAEDTAWKRCFPNGESAYAAARNNITMAKGAVKRLPGRMTVTRDRLNLKKNAQHLFDQGFDGAIIIPQVESPWSPERDARTLRKSFKELADWYIDTARAGTILPLDITNIYLHRYHRSLQCAPRQEAPCGCGRSLLGVDTQGNLLPCHQWLAMPDRRVGALWSGINQERKDFFERFTSNGFKECSACPAAVICAGPCMALSGQFAGDPLRPLLGHCLFTRAHLEAIQYLYHTLRIEENPPFLRFLERSRDFLERRNLDPNSNSSRTKRSETRWTR